MRIPQGTSEADFKAAVQEFANVVGPDWVFTSDEDVAAYRDAYSPFVGQPDKMNVAGAAVSPTTVEQVQQITRIANKYTVPLFAISTGRNLGYGGSSPPFSGSVIVDLAVERGGNVEGAKPGEVTQAGPAKIVGYLNVPGRLAASASALYAKNLLTFLETMIDKKTKTLAVNWDDELVKGTVLTRDGAVVHPNFMPKS